MWKYLLRSIYAKSTRDLSRQTSKIKEASNNFLLIISRWSLKVRTAAKFKNAYCVVRKHLCTVHTNKFWRGIYCTFTKYLKRSKYNGTYHNYQLDNYCKILTKIEILTPWWLFVNSVSGKKPRNFKKAHLDEGFLETVADVTTKGLLGPGIKGNIVCTVWSVDDGLSGNLRKPPPVGFRQVFSNISRPRRFPAGFR